MEKLKEEKIKVKSKCGSGGFTLVELMIAMAIAGIVAAAILMAFNSHQKTQVSQQLVVDMQQDLRAAMSLMQRDMRMAGYDETWVDSNTDGIDDNRLTDGLDNDCDVPFGGGVDDPVDMDEANDISGVVLALPNEIQIRMDQGRDGTFCEANDLITYALADGETVADIDSDGVDNATTDLRRGNVKLIPSPPTIELQPLAGSIQAVSFGYAFDDDGGAATTDGQIDTDAGGNILWAYDSDNDGNLDTLLDRNGDGLINSADDSNGDGRITNADAVTTPLPALVPLNRIRAVQIWLLARSRAPLRDHRDTETYNVGHNILTPGDTNNDGVINGSDTPDNYKRELLVSSVTCRNLGLR